MSKFFCGQVYGWTGENNYIVRGGTSSLVVGSSQGHFGLWLDENFNMGRSMAVSTFRSGILTINAPVVYMGRYEVVLRGDYP
jgi:hypothetical protein